MNFNLDDDNDLSIKKFEKMLKTNEVRFFDSDEFEDIIEYYLEAGKMNMARKAIKLGITQHPDATNIRLLHAEILVFDDKFDEANLELNALHELEPDNSEIYIQKANIFSKQDDHAIAIDCLNIALKLTEDKSDVYNLLGMEFLFVDDFSNAKVNFLNCLELDPSDYSSLYNIIYCFEYLEEYEDAIDFLNTFLDDNPYSEVAWHQIGKMYYEIEAYEKALSSFEFAIISDEYFIGAYLEKGKVLEKLARFEEAIENYLATCELDDPTPFAYLRIGKCYLKLKQEQKAIKFFKKCLKEDPLQEKAWLALSTVYKEKKQFKKALNYIEQAVDIILDYPHLWSEYAHLNRMMGNIKEAEIGYLKTIELGSYELNIWLYRADMLKSLNKNKTLITHLDQALDIFPEEGEIMYRLAGAYYLTGDIIKGSFYLQSALKIAPELFICMELLYPEVMAIEEVKNLLNIG